ncbi:hypothetical protein Btru_005365, partial [Bulinus truncatus]
MEILFQLLLVLTFSYIVPVEDTHNCLEPEENLPFIRGFVGEKILSLTLLKYGIWSSSVQDITTGEDISHSFSVSRTNETDPFVWTMQVANPLPLNLRTESHELIFTIHCTVHSISTLYIRRATLLPQQQDDESIHILIAITVWESTIVHAIAAELYRVLNVSDTALSLIVLRDGQINEVESLYLELTKNGVITLQQSLNSSSEEIFLYILRRV